MKVIIPLAGKGTRLRPHTHITPKPMLKVAGKPVMSYVLDELKKLGNVEQIIYITGHLKEKVEEYARAEMDVSSVFIEQKIQDGTAGAVALARDYMVNSLPAPLRSHETTSTSPFSSFSWTRYSTPI